MMDSVPSKKHFTGEERVALKSLVAKYHSIIDNKKADSVSAAQKKKEWLKLAQEFNSMGENSYKTADQLKKCWDNMKTRRKKELAVIKRHSMGTGGGPSKTPPPADDIDDILQNVDIELKKTVDSDTIPIENNMEHDLMLALENDILLATEDVPHNVTPAKGETNKVRKNIYTSRGTAIERELEARLKRNELLTQHESELHELRMEEQKIKILIAKEQLLQEELRTKIIKKQLDDNM